MLSKGGGSGASSISWVTKVSGACGAQAVLWVKARLCCGKEGRGSKAGSSPSPWELGEQPHIEKRRRAMGSQGEGDEWVTASVALFPRDVPSSLSTSLIAGASVAPRGGRSRR